MHCLKFVQSLCHRVCTFLHVDPNAHRLWIQKLAPCKNRGRDCACKTNVPWQRLPLLCISNQFMTNRDMAGRHNFVLLSRAFSSIPFHHLQRVIRLYSVSQKSTACFDFYPWCERWLMSQVFGFTKSKIAPLTAKYLFKKTPLKCHMAVKERQVVAFVCECRTATEKKVNNIIKQGSAQ